MNRSFALIVCLVASSATFAAPAPATNRQMLLDVQPAAAPVPALKYQLLPGASEMQPGNAFPAWLKCFAEQTNFFFNKESGQERERLAQCPLTDIKPGSLKGYGGSALKQADLAARHEYCDWNLLPQIREQGYNLLLPELQQMRLLAQALAVRCRGQIVDKDYDGAIHGLKTIFALARHLGDHPTIISGLVGVAIAQIGINLVEELIQQPDAPNLYWALTGLPSQLVDMRKAYSADRLVAEATFGQLLDAKRTWSAEDVANANRKLSEHGALMEMSPEDREATATWIRDRAKDKDWQEMARKGLAQGGYPADMVAKYPPEQLLLYHLVRVSRNHHDEAVKWVPVPYWQSEAPLSELENTQREAEDKLTRQMVFSVSRIKTAHARVEQRLGLLRAVEAIRLDAAKNGGKLPANLSDLSVPIPNDPSTGKPFAYKIDGITATLEGKATPVFGGGTMKYGYEVRLRK